VNEAAAFVSFLFSRVWRFLVSGASSGYLPWHLRPEPKARGMSPRERAGIEWSTGSETAAPQRGAEKWPRRFLHAVGGLARALPRQTAVHRKGHRQRRTRPEIHADRGLARCAGQASGASQSDGALSSGGS
jgi:hypothetical protein